MTAPVTDGEVRSESSIENPAVDDDGERRASDARAREDTSKVAVTDSYRKGLRVLRGWRVAAGRWWAWTDRPVSLRAAWRLSAVDPRRVPKGAPWWLPELWRLSNWTDRLVWFALMLVAPSGLQGPLRYLAVRPMRRLGTYVVIAGLAVVFTAVKGH